ncbi:hypothetical protein J5Y03_09205 [Bacillus sp. RG28]|uniref:Uncharacterized protein n=1 Tax=Gottfriedia endophytica TaxID=2820819 RepID=A0A940NPV2_9BACI|nr:hypothetical protein [Gottfriedia endophytica]MBP0725363.1 hypothetical protein [Gottfriedia endophytica]
MLINLLTEFKNWWFGEFKVEFEEIERLESKHTRVRFDFDVHELIRIH